MSLWGLTAWQIKHMFRRRSFAVVFTLLLLFSLGTFLLYVIPLYGTGTVAHFAAWNEWGPMSKSGEYSHQSWEIIYIFLLPFLASLSNADCYFTDFATGMYKNILSRCERSRYLLSCAIVVFVGGFVVFFIPLLVNQLLWLIAVPTDSMVFEQYVRDGVKDMFFSSCFINAPYLNNFIYMLIPSVLCGLIALLSFAISLFFKQKRFLVLTVPGIVYVVINYIVSMIGYYAGDIANYMVPFPPVYRLTKCFLYAFLVGLFILDMAAIVVKVTRKKDEL